MKAFLLLLAASCGMTQRPGDLLGPGTMCQPLSDYVQRCTDRSAKTYRCSVEDGRWSCSPE